MESQRLSAKAKTVPQIRAENVTCKYGPVVAVDRVSLNVSSGEILAVLGTNGAGKTTLISALQGQRRTASGRITVLGDDPATSRRFRSRVGTMLQDGGFAADLTAKETLRLLGRLSGRRDDADTLLARVGLGAKARTRVDVMSGGERRRLDLAAALWGDPELLFLDEPTTGLDPEARKTMWKLVRERSAAGAAVLVSTHYLEEAEQNADQIILMHGGRIRREGTLAELSAHSRSNIEFRVPRGTGKLPPGATRLDDQRVTLESNDVQADLILLLAWADRQRVELTNLTTTNGTTLARIFEDVAGSPVHEETRS